MRNYQLQKSSLFNLLCETGVQQAEGRVRSQSLLEEMSIVGFIPYTDDYNQLWDFGTSMNLNGELYVAPFLMKFSKDTPVYPYFKTISKAEGKKFILNDHIYIDTVIDKIPKEVLKWRTATRPLSGEAFLKVRTKSWNPECLLESDDEGKLYYVGKPDDWELSCGLGNMKYLSNNFLCLCSYMNKETGTPSYAVLTSDDAIRVLPGDNTEASSNNKNKVRPPFGF